MQEIMSHFTIMHVALAIVILILIGGAVFWYMDEKAMKKESEERKVSTARHRRRVADRPTTARTSVLPQASGTPMQQVQPINSFAANDSNDSSDSEAVGELLVTATQTIVGTITRAPDPTPIDFGSPSSSDVGTSMGNTPSPDGW